MSVLDRTIAANFPKEIIDQRKAYLVQAETVARALGRLASVSDRTLGSLPGTEADAQLLEALHQKSAEILALERQLRELWAPVLTEAAARDARVTDGRQPVFGPIPASPPRRASSR